VSGSVQVLSLTGPYQAQRHTVGSPHFIWIASSTTNLEGECFVGYRSEVSCFSWTLLGKRVAWLMAVVPNWISSYFYHKTHTKSSAVILYDRLWLGKWDSISKPWWGLYIPHVLQNGGDFCSSIKESHRIAVGICRRLWLAITDFSNLRKLPWKKIHNFTTTTSVFLDTRLWLISNYCLPCRVER